MTTTTIESISYNGSKYVLQKRIEIKYNRPTLFHGPRMAIERFHSLTTFYETKEDYLIIINRLNEILCATYIPIWLWMLVFIGSLGLLTWIIIIEQKKKTLKQGLLLKEFVTEKNSELLDKIDKNRGLNGKIEQNNLLLFEIPFPSKNKVILHACFYERVLENDSKLIL